MSKVKEISIRCLHCGKWFPSPIYFEDSKVLDTAKIFSNLAQCPRCKEMTGCNMDNFRAIFEDGGFIGNNI